MSINEIEEKVNPMYGSPEEGYIPIDQEGNTLKKDTSKLIPQLRPYLLLVLTLLSGGTLFSLGRISSTDSKSTPINIKYENVASVLGAEDSEVSNQTKSKSTKGSASNSSAQIVVPTPKTNGEVIGSKSGKKYYFPWCGTVKRIKLENQVHFASIELAKKAGYTPGGNCKGIY